MINDYSLQSLEEKQLRGDNIEIKRTQNPKDIRETFQTN